MYSFRKEEYMQINEKIIQAVGENDENAFNILYDEYATKTAIFIGTYVRNIEDAKDITQDLFIDLPKLIKGKYKYESASKFKSWLFQIAKRRALDFVKTRKCFEEISDEIFYQNDNSKEVHYIIEIQNVLSHIEYIIFTLHSIEQFTFKEIAILINMSIDKIKKIYVNAVKKLKKFYKEK